MPGFDGTGPNGSGPMTGRGQGRCGMQRGNGWGRPRGRRFMMQNQFGWQQPNPADRIENLDQYKKELEEEINLLNQELKELKNK